MESAALASNASSIDSTTADATSPSASLAAATGAALASTSAVEACLNTTELLENILKFVDVKSLVLAQAVSRQFKDVVVGSLALQRKLFLIPSTFEQALDTADGEKEGMQNWFAPDGKPKACRWNDDKQLGFDRLFMVNPALLYLLDKADGKTTSSHQIWMEHFSPANEPTNPNDSLHRMFLFHPMPERVRFYCTLRSDNYEYEQACIDVPAFHGNRPRTFGKLIEAVEPMAQEGLGTDWLGDPFLLRDSAIVLPHTKSYKLSEMRKKIAG